MSIRAKKIWRNGRLVDWEDATVHISSHAISYGTSWFEGIRCYKTRRGPEVFRLREHVERLFDSCKIYRTEIPFSPEEIEQAILDTISGNGFEACYIRPLVLRGVGTLDLSPQGAQVETFVFAWEWGDFLGAEAKELGVDVCTSSWARVAPNTIPALSKAAGNYLSSALIKMEAVQGGYAEGIALDTKGVVSEGSGENLFLVRDEVVYTPEVTQAILPGITRSAVIQLTRELGIEVAERAIPREMLYLADELFFTGTAAEVTPVRSVDKIPTKCAGRGPITTRIQKAFFEITEGRQEDRFGWMTPVGARQRA